MLFHIPAVIWEGAKIQGPVLSGDGPIPTIRETPMLLPYRRLYLLFYLQVGLESHVPERNQADERGGSETDEALSVGSCAGSIKRPTTQAAVADWNEWQH